MNAVTKAVDAIAKQTTGEQKISQEIPRYTRKDFQSTQEVRWCPGCGDYSILTQLQKVLATLPVRKENQVVVGGIGCSSRLPYYVNTYGIHGIHGRAPAIATGIKIANPNLTVWIATGDGDALSIGGNHLLHVLRRNVDVKILLFNNRIYGLTKGQYSPTSVVGQNTRSTPMGSIDNPLDPVSVALAAGATFVARSLDTNTKHMQETLARAAAHKGTAFVEIYQNCPIFNDEAFAELKNGQETALYLENGKPLNFGNEQSKGIAVNSQLHTEVVDASADNVLIHDEKNLQMQQLIAHLQGGDFPVPFGVFRAIEAATYENRLEAQVATAEAKRKGKLQDLLESGETWIVD